MLTDFLRAIHTTLCLEKFVNDVFTRNPPFAQSVVSVLKSRGKKHTKGGTADKVVRMLPRFIKRV